MALNWLSASQDAQKQQAIANIAESLIKDTGLADRAAGNVDDDEPSTKIRKHGNEFLIAFRKKEYREEELPRAIVLVKNGPNRDDPVVARYFYTRREKPRFDAEGNVSFFGIAEMTDSPAAETAAPAPAKKGKGKSKAASNALEEALEALT